MKKVHTPPGIAEKNIHSTEQEPEFEAGTEHFRLLIQNSNDSICLIDKNGRQFYVNDAACRITGYSKEELIGNFDQVIYPEDLEVVNAAWKTVKESNDLITVRYRHKHKTKEFVWMEAVGKNHLEHPSIKAAVINVRDITEQKQMEELINRQNEELNKLNQIKDALIAAESEKSRLLNESLEQRKKELTTNALMLAQLNGFQSRIMDDLKEICQGDRSDSYARIHTLMSEISGSMHSVNWENFQNRFEELNQDFYKKVRTGYPLLTAAELRLMAFIKLGFSSKEISSLLQNSPDSILVARSRLRKKLNLLPAENLALFIDLL